MARQGFMIADPGRVRGVVRALRDEYGSLRGLARAMGAPEYFGELSRLASDAPGRVGRIGPEKLTALGMLADRRGLLEELERGVWGETPPEEAGAASADAWVVDSWREQRSRALLACLVPARPDEREALAATLWELVGDRGCRAALAAYWNGAARSLGLPSWGVLPEELAPWRLALCLLHDSRPAGDGATVRLPWVTPHATLSRTGRQRDELTHPPTLLDLQPVRREGGRLVVNLDERYWGGFTEAGQIMAFRWHAFLLRAAYGMLRPVVLLPPGPPSGMEQVLEPDAPALPLARAQHLEGLRSAGLLVEWLRGALAAELALLRIDPAFRAIAGDLPRRRR